jgi:hypothetical protein
MEETNNEWLNTPFCGKVVVLGGDPKQILPVIENGSKSTNHKRFDMLLLL